jgi:hypothetical protein
MTTKTTNTPTTQTAATTSRYPRPSAPGFLYPQPIVSPHIYSHAMQRDASHHSPGSLHHSLAHKDPYAIPTSLIAVLVFAVVAGAGLWAVIVMLIHWHGTATGMSSSGSRERSTDDNTERNTRWWPWLQKINPCARSGARYEALNSADEHELNEYAAGKTSAHDFNAPADDGIGSDSPINPFLVAPDQSLYVSVRTVRPRGSAEWAQEHRAYFSSPFGSRSSAAHSREYGSTQSLSNTEMEGIEAKAEAREAQGRRASLAPGGARALGRQQRASWVDLGLAAVDGAVDRLAGRIVRYVDDGGKDEALLMPLPKGKQD